MFCKYQIWSLIPASRFSLAIVFKRPFIFLIIAPCTLNPFVVRLPLFWEIWQETSTAAVVLYFTWCCVNKYWQYNASLLGYGSRIDYLQVERFCSFQLGNVLMVLLYIGAWSVWAIFVTLNLIFQSPFKILKLFLKCLNCSVIVHNSWLHRSSLMRISKFSIIFTMQELKKGNKTEFFIFH